MDVPLPPPSRLPHSTTITAALLRRLAGAGALDGLQTVSHVGALCYRCCCFKVLLFLDALTSDPASDPDSLLLPRYLYGCRAYALPGLLLWW